MKIIDETLVEYRVSKNFEIELDTGETILVNKWVRDSDTDKDNAEEYEFLGEDKEKFDKMTEEDQDKLVDFINEIKL